MDPKKLKADHDEAKRALSAEREAHRATEAKVEELKREIAPLRLRVALTGATKGIVEALDSAMNRAYNALANADHHESEMVSANLALTAKDREIEVRAARIAFLEGEIAGFRRDSIAANAEADRAAARASAAENRVRDIFYRLTRDLAPGWQGKSLRDLMGDPAHARRMHVLLQRVIDWLNEEAQRPAPKATPADCAYEGCEAPAEPGDVYCSECRASENAEQARIAKIAACAGCYTDEACDIADACPKRGNKTRAERDAVIDDMALPEGRMCGECAFWPSCLAMISSLDPRSRRCDYSPSRWVPPVISNRVKEIKARESAADDDLCGDRPSTLAVTEILDEVAL